MQDESVRAESAASAPAPSELGEVGVKRLRPNDWIEAVRHDNPHRAGSKRAIEYSTILDHARQEKDGRARVDQLTKDGGVHPTTIRLHVRLGHLRCLREYPTGETCPACGGPDPRSVLLREIRVA